MKDKLEGKIEELEKALGGMIQRINELEDAIPQMNEELQRLKGAKPAMMKALNDYKELLGDLAKGDNEGGGSKGKR